jgi:hypothetical protein
MVFKFDNLRLGGYFRRIGLAIFLSIRQLSQRSGSFMACHTSVPPGIQMTAETLIMLALSLNDSGSWCVSSGQIIPLFVDVDGIPYPSGDTPYWTLVGPP